MKILLIEDDNKISSFIKRGLEEDNYAVDTANNGDEGLQMALRNDYALVILDINLPGKDGFEVCGVLRKTKASLPVLMLTGRTDPADIVRGLNTGADDYLTKPFSFEELLARIHALLRRFPQSEHLILAAGSLVLDRNSRQVSINGNTVELSAKEYAMLEYLMRHPDMLITRVMLEQSLWNQEFEGSSNMVEVYISRLRNKLGKEGENLIQTVYGAGYRLVKP
jgi:Response regulators consisting of a CheY-like receiver domain and a winged-helix DNA-binding domain